MNFDQLRKEIEREASEATLRITRQPHYSYGSPAVMRAISLRDLETDIKYEMVALIERTLERCGVIVRLPEGAREYCNGTHGGPACSDPACRTEAGLTRESCDGDHGGPPCEDPCCWSRK